MTRWCTAAVARRWARQLAVLAVAAAALAGSACDRLVNLTPAQDARVLNDGEPPPDAEPPDTAPPPDALEIDAFIVAPDATTGIDSAIAGAAALGGEPSR